MAGTRRKPGELGPYVEGYRAWLTARGYTPLTVRNMLKDLGQVGQWMSREALVTSQLDEETMVSFLATRQPTAGRQTLGPRAMVPLLTYLREVDVSPARRPSQPPLVALLGEYRRWMLQERGLAKGRVAELRSVLRFLYLRGVTPLRLGAAVPPVGGWRLATGHAAAARNAGPGGPVAAGQLRPKPRLGVRDFAIMTLVARLGLRSIEVARLELRDVDWRAVNSSCVARAAGQDRLPLPSAVGEALVAYLAWDRILGDTRRLFPTCRAPRGPIRADLAGDVVERACLRAGLPRVGPHRLRNALAAELLRQGPGARDQPGPSPSGPGDDRPLRQGRPGDAAAGRAAVAGDDRVSALEKDLIDYLQLRHSLGHQLAEAQWLGFVAYLDVQGLRTVTVQAALGWAQQHRRVGHERRAAAVDRRS